MLRVVSKSKPDKNARKLMSDSKFYEGYSRWDDSLNRYETWGEAVERVMDMHREYYKEHMTDELSEMIDEAEKYYKGRYVLGAQRALQFGGDQVLKHQMRLYNCFDVNTRFLTHRGMKSFADFADGDSVIVKTHTGQWQNATVRSYGRERLNRIVLKRKGSRKVVHATANHRWILKDGFDTTDLQVGDQLQTIHDTNFEDFTWNDATVEQKLMWCYGYVYGDGTVTNAHSDTQAPSSLVRLCGKGARFEHRFVEMGFNTSTNLSLGGDVFVYTGSYLKTLPTTDDTVENLTAFVRGFLDADGTKSSSYWSKTGKSFNSIYQVSSDAQEFIRNVFPLVGAWVDQETDWSKKNVTTEIDGEMYQRIGTTFSLITTYGTKGSAYWTVESIDETDRVETVWCLEVEKDKSFILEGGIVTGNCTSSYADRPGFFGELFYILLCGAGAGFSVQKHHVDKLPDIAERKKQAKEFTPDDSIEGWADSAAVLMSSYFVGGGVRPEYEGRKVYFNLNKIRPKGAMISGGFKAPGPEPLRRALDKIEHLLQGLVLSGVTRLSPIHVYDICMFIADAVLAGGVRRSATICLFSANDQDMIKAKTGDWYITHPERARSNNSAVIVRNEITREEFAEIMKPIKEFGEPGFYFVNSKDHTTNPCVEIGMFPQFEGVSGWQGCVAGDTKLITREGIFDIEELEGKEVEIWNGEKWSKVTPTVTGNNREFYRVSFGDGSYIDVTENHEFLVKNRFENEYRIVKTTELLRDEKYVISVPSYTIERDETEKTDIENAYDYGFILGDGNVRGHKKSATAIIYEDHFDKNFPVTGRLQSENKCEYSGKIVKTFYWNRNNLNLDLAHDLKYCEELPLHILSTWSRKSLLDFFAGWIDTDGTVTNKGAARIYGKEGHIRSAQILLTEMGIRSSANLASKSGTKTNFGTRNRDLYYLHITETKDLYCHKGTLISRKPKRKGKNVTVKSVEKIIGLRGTSFCFEEQELHQGVFNNVLTKQCNLTEINGSKCVTQEDFYNACRAASILGTLQAGYTDFKYVDDTTKKIFDREALLGVSVTGWMNNPSVLFDADVQRKGATIVKDVNKVVAKMIGINPAARTTCVKPSGNASVLLQTASGIHEEHSPRYLRHVQMNKESEVAQLILAKNPYMVEESVWSTGKTDYVIAFPVIPKAGSIFKEESKGVSFLEKVKLVQQNWVEAGTDVDLCVDPTVRHNVSNTVTVPKQMWTSVEDYLYENRNYFAGVSFLADSGDKDFNQAPNAEVLTEDQIVQKYGAAALFASGLIVDTRKGFDNLWDATFEAQIRGEDLAAGEIADARRDWIRRFKKFADNYFDGDMKQAEYCLKDVFYLHKWVKIQQNLEEVEFGTELETKKFTDVDTMGAAACVGPNGCEVSF